MRQTSRSSRGARVVAQLGIAAFVLVLVVAAALGFVAEYSGDFHWHLALGDWSLDNGAIYRVDTLSHTYRGARMTVSAWLGDVLLAGAYRAAGLIGAYVVRSAALLVLVTALVLDARRAGLALLTASALCLLFLADAWARFYLRPETLAFAVFAVVLLMLGRARRTVRWQPRVVVIGLICLWANLHGSVAVGLLAVGLTSCEMACRRGLARDRRGALLWLGTVVAATLAACLSAEGVGTVLVYRMLDAGCNDQREWQPFLLTMATEIEVLGGLAFVVSAIAALVLEPSKADIGRLALALALIGLTSTHRRFVTVASIACLASLASNLAVIAQHPWVVAQGDRARLVAAAGALAVFTYATGSLAGEKVHRELSLDLAPDVYPVQACAFVRENPPPGAMLNSFDVGGFLTHCLEGRAEVAIDQRVCSLYSGDFYQRYVHGTKTSEGLHTLADDLGASWIFAQYDALARAAANDPARWSLVYADDDALIYARLDAPETAAWASSSPLRFVDPLRIRPSAVREERDAGLALQEERCPDCGVTRLMEAVVRLAENDVDGATAALDAMTPVQRTKLGAAESELRQAVASHKRK